jgi:hypothetical protein
MTIDLSRRDILVAAASVGGFGLVAPDAPRGQDLRLAQAGGALLAARIARDGWTIELDFADLGEGRVDPTRLALDVRPPQQDFLGVSMAGVAARPVRGTAANINPWYDADHPFPQPVARSRMLTVPVRLDRPVRGGETVQVTLAPGLAPGAQGGALRAENRSGLMVCRHAQDRYTQGDGATLLAEVDCLTGCRIPDASLVPASALPTKFDPNHPVYPNIAFDARIRRVVVGAGPSDAGLRILSGIDLRADATGGYFVLANAPRVIIRDCLFDDANLYSVTSGSSVTSLYRVYFNEMRGALERTKGDFTDLPQATRGHGAFFLRHRECESEVRLNRIHGSTNDGVIIIRGTCAQNAVYSQGWDNRRGPGHADGIWCPTMVPGAPKLLVERNFVDSRDPGHGFSSITGSLSINLPLTQSHNAIPPAESYFDGLVARWNLMLSHRISWNMTDGIVGATLKDDRRYIRGHHVHNNWFTAPHRVPPTTPLFPWKEPHHRWSPDARWNDNIDPTTGQTWAMGPQPRDMLFSVSVEPDAAKAGDTVTWTLMIARYLAQYGPVTLAVAESGSGFGRSLAADIRAAIDGYRGVSFADGVFTFRQGLVGRGVGHANEAVRLTIARQLKPTAAGRHALNIANNSAGSIIDASAACRVG